MDAGNTGKSTYLLEKRTLSGIQKTLTIGNKFIFNEVIKWNI